MPRTYSDDEREYIKKRLKEEAADLISTFGIRRTTVDDLVERVKIPKGTFYLFYDSKELLLFEALMEQHEMLETQMLKEIKSLNGRAAIDTLTEIIYRFFKAADDSGILRLITSGEIELLQRKLPQEVIRNHFAHDSSMIRNILELLSISPSVHIEHFAAAFQNLFIAMVHKRETGKTYFDEALKLTIKGLVIQLLTNGTRYRTKVRN